MDVYGAFQLCSIGILAAPVTVKVSRTYFYDPGRNTIFAWTALILAGEHTLTNCPTYLIFNGKGYLTNDKERSIELDS
jgi:hypothetical protein